MPEKGSTIIDTSSPSNFYDELFLSRSPSVPILSTIPIKLYPRFHLIGAEQYDIDTIPLVSFGFYSCSAIVVKDLQSDLSQRVLGHIFHGFEYERKNEEEIIDEYMPRIIDLFQSKTKKLVAAIITSCTRNKLEKSCQKHNITIVEKLEIRRDKLAQPYGDDRDNYIGDDRDVWVFPETSEIMVNTKSFGLKVISF